MCFNSTVSLGSYIFGLVNSFILFRRGYKIEGILYGFIIQMQLIEYLLWNNNKCNSVNKTITKIGISLNHFQPYLLYLAIIYFNGFNQLSLYIHQLVFIYLCVNIFYFYVNYQLLFRCTIGIENKKELQWLIQYGKEKKFYFFFVFMLAILCINGLKKYNYLNAFLLTLTFIISYIKYYDSKGVGSIWCLLAAYIPFILNIIYYIDEKNNTKIKKMIINSHNYNHKNYKNNDKLSNL